MVSGIHLVPCFASRFPYFYHDEYGVLGAAAVMSGLEWTTPPNIPFYGFGLSLLIVPLFKLSLAPVVLYRAALSVNALLVASSAVLILHTVRLIIPSISSIFRVGAVIAALSYPAVQFYAGLAMGETILLFCFALIFYGIVAIADRKDSTYIAAILLGLGLGLAPYAHSRGLVFWLAVLPTCWLGRRLGGFKLKPLIIALSSAIITASPLSYLKAWLIVHFYPQVLPGTGNAIDFLSTKLTLLDPERLKVLMQVSWGQFAYLSTSSLGLALVGMAAIAMTLWPIRRSFSNQAFPLDTLHRKQVIAAAFVGLSTLLMLGLSAIALAYPTRADHYFYGRYNEVLMPPLILAAILFLTALDGRKRYVRFLGLAAMGCISACLMLSVIKFPDDVFSRWMIWNSLSGWFPHISGQWRVDPPRILLGVLVGNAILVATILLSRRLFILLSIALFIAATLHNYKIQHQGADHAWDGYNRLAAIYGAALEDKSIQVLPQSDGVYAFEATQFAFPRSRIILATDKIDTVDAILDKTETYCNEKNTIDQVGTAKFCICDPKLRDELAQHTKMFPPPSARNCPPARIRSEKKRIVTGGLIRRTCAIAADHFYSGWFRYALPRIEVSVTRDGLSGLESQKLGFYITDSNYNWLLQWRVDMDTQALSKKESLKITSFIRFGGFWPAGKYRLNVAVIDSHGWDFRNKLSIPMLLK